MIQSVENLQFTEDGISFTGHQSWLSKKNFNKWLRLAAFVEENENSCLSRKVGVIIVDPRADSVVSTGHNGTPHALPGCDSSDYLSNVVVPQLTSKELQVAGCKSSEFAQKYANCGTCPRKLVGAPSGQRLDLCQCIHGEVDAIVKAKRSLSDCYMVCGSGVPCIECTKVILKSNLEAVICWDHGNGAKADYSSYSSRWLFEKSNTKLILVPMNWVVNS